jgi:hypothetical protein
MNKLNFAVFAGYVTKCNKSGSFEITVFSRTKTTILCLPKEKIKVLSLKLHDGILVKGQLVMSGVQLSIRVDTMRYAQTYDLHIDFFGLTLNRIKNNNYFKLQGTVSQIKQYACNARSQVELYIDSPSQIPVSFNNGFADAIMHYVMYGLLDKYIYTYGKLVSNNLVVKSFEIISQ